MPDAPLGGEADLEIVLASASPGERCELYAKTLAPGSRNATGPALRVMFMSMTDAARFVLAERRTVAAHADDPK